MRGRTLLSIAVGVLTVAACSTSGDVRVGPSETDAGAPAAPTTTSAPSGTAGPAGPSAPQVVWGSCASSLTYDVKGWECGTIEAPLDYSAPNGDTITLALTRFRAA